MLTAYGFTTVVDTGSFPENTVALRRRIETGDVAGPRISTSGLPLYPPAGIPYYIAGLEVTLSGGVDVIAHVLDDTRGLTTEHLRRMKGRNVALIPTLTLFAEARNAGVIFREVVDYAALGGEILLEPTGRIRLGTDPGFADDHSFASIQ